MSKSLDNYFLSLRKQEVPTVCGLYATSFASEAKANMRNIGKEEIDIETLIYNWNAIDGVIDKVPEGFLLSDVDNDNIPDSFKKVSKLRLWCNTYSLQQYNFQRVGNDVESLKRVIDNMVSPVVYIEFKMRRIEDFVTVYSSSTQSGLKTNGHVVAIKGYTDNYFILHDSNQGKDNRIYFKDASIIKLAVVFNTKIWDKTYNHPLRKVFITQGFGENKDYYKKFGGQFVNGHMGLDYRASVGTDVYPCFSGKVIKIDFNKYEGNRIFIEKELIVAKYAHLSLIKCRVGDKVNINQVIGQTGNTGESTTAPHLHFDIQVDKLFVNPLNYIDSD